MSSFFKNHFDSSYHKAPSENNVVQTISTRFKLSAIVIVSSFVAIYIALLSLSILDSKSAETAAISIVNQYYPVIDDSQWHIFKSSYPPKPANFNTSLYDGNWPSSTWDPTGKYSTGSRETAVRFEISLSALSPLTSGATSNARARLVVPDHFYDHSTLPPKPLYTVSCIFGSDVDVSSGAKSAPAQYFDLKLTDFQFPYGSILQYPFDRKLQQHKQ